MFISFSFLPVVSICIFVESDVQFSAVYWNAMQCSNARRCSAIYLFLVQYILSWHNCVQADNILWYNCL